MLDNVATYQLTNIDNKWQIVLYDLTLCILYESIKGVIYQTLAQNYMNFVL